MGHKIVCIECRKSLNKKFEKDSDRLYPCSNCGKPMTILPHRFRPPKKVDNKRWETVKYLIENGFYYQHIYEKIETKDKFKSLENFAEYPENMRDAILFVERFREQAKKS